MIWLFLVFYSFLEVIPSGTIQEYFHPRIFWKFALESPQLTTMWNLGA
jgi:hypothetical protein